MGKKVPNSNLLSSHKYTTGFNFVKRISVYLLQLSMEKASKKLWFKAKNYGWGWYPVTWQGWSITLLYIAVLFWRTSALSKMFDTATSFSWRYMFEIAAITIPLIVICYATGEKPEWRWGEKKK
jgi:hypothetical protein